MHIIVGLGNPGKKYEKTRHNIGFRVVEALAEKNNFPVFSFSEKFNALISGGNIASISKGNIKNEKIILVLPQTFMNNSGTAVQSIKSYYKVNNNNIIVIHDDIDLKIETVKTVKDRGPAGHNGVISIIKEIGTQDFKRVRIGVQPEKGNPANIEKFVLQKFSKKEEEILEEIILESINSIENIIF